RLCCVLLCQRLTVTHDETLSNLTVIIITQTENLIKKLVLNISVVKNPGETLSLSCRGSGFTFTSYAMAWIRQPAGKGLEWLGLGYSRQSSNIYASSVRGRIEISREDSNSMTHLRLSNLKPEDSAVYYCAAQP
uniref:Ig-like domain-containing protein n=1 Tax=Poecilia formosa TaxID=48698 RepID=A0A096LZV1_POEFO